MAKSDYMIEELASDVAYKSLQVIQSYLENPSAEKHDVHALKAAQASFSSYTRLKQTKSAEDATTAMLARSLANDPKELAHYLAVAMPSSPLIKAMNPPPIEAPKT